MTIKDRQKDVFKVICLETASPSVCCGHGRLGASAVVTPSEAAGVAPFDVSLEVTGNPRGLQVGS